MTIPATTVTIDVLESDGNAVVAAVVTAQLTTYDIYQDQIIHRELETTTTNGSGRATLALFPNVIGERGTAYNFKIRHPTTNRLIYQTVAQVPETACTLTDIAGNLPDPAVQQLHPTITFPTTGTLATLAGDEVLSNKSFSDAVTFDDSITVLGDGSEFGDGSRAITGNTDFTGRNIGAHYDFPDATGFLSHLFMATSSFDMAAGPQALEGYAVCKQTGTTALAIGTIGNVEHSSSGTVTSMWGVTATVVISGTGGGTNATSFRAAVTGRVAAGSGTFTNGIGVDITFGSGFTNKYTLRSVDADAVLSHAGPVSIGPDALSQSTFANLSAATAARSSLRLNHGAAPSAPVDGDMWTTAAGGLFIRHNGVTKSVNLT